jgi:hypothetical protein
MLQCDTPTGERREVVSERLHAGCLQGDRLVLALLVINDLVKDATVERLPTAWTDFQVAAGSVGVVARLRSRRVRAFRFDRDHRRTHLELNG